jgi:tRNA(fMet)-specific endonuclease VapC
VWVHGYLLDTNIVAYWFDERRSEHERVVQHIQELPDATPLMISAITLGEIEYGLQVARIDILKQEAFHAFISTNLPMVLDITKATRIYYGSLRASVFEKYAPNARRRRGLRPEQLIDPVTSRELGIQENDLWIAAQALEYNLVLVTNDKMDRIRDVCEDVQVKNWTANASE